MWLLISTSILVLSTGNFIILVEKKFVAKVMGNL